MEIDIHDYDRQLKKEIEAIKERCSKENQQLVLDYDLKYTIKLGLSKARRIIILNKLKLICTKIDKPLSNLTPQNIEALELKLIQEGLSKRSQKDYRDILKQFFRWLDEEKGERWEWIQKNFKNHKVPLKTYKPEDFMNEEERQIFLNSAQTNFERALASIFLTSGCRVSEVGNMKIGSVEFLDANSCVLQVRGKTGERRIKLYQPTTSYLKEWLKNHPRRNDSTAAFWINNRGEPYTYNGVVVALKRLGKRGGIKKPLNPHSFRHMVYTQFQLKGVPQAIRENYFGHVHGSKMARIYTHTSDKEVFDYLDSMHEKQERKYRDVKLEIEMKQCAKCLKTFLPHETFCDNCNISLEKSILEQQEINKIKEEMAERIAKFEEEKSKMRFLQQQVLAMSKDIEELKKRK